MKEKNEEMEALCVEEKMKNEEMRRIERKKTKKKRKESKKERVVGCKLA